MKIPIICFWYWHDFLTWNTLLPTLIFLYFSSDGFLQMLSMYLLHLNREACDYSLKNTKPATQTLKCSLADDVHSSFYFLSVLVESVDHHYRCLDRILRKSLTKKKSPNRKVSYLTGQSGAKWYLMILNKPTCRISSLMCTSLSFFDKVLPVSGEMKYTPDTEKHAASFGGSLINT